MDNLRRWLYNNSLSLAFFVFFAASLAGQSIAGLADFNAHRAMFSAPPLTYRQYLHTGHFADGVFTNWQAAILQLGCLIVFATWLRQKGASHSLKPNGKLAGKRGNIRRYSWLRRNSLSLAFAGLFVGSLSAHVIFGTIAYNEMQVLSGMPPVSVAAYIATGTFWFTLTQTWQAEFIGMGLFLVLSIFLRQEGSAESKPVESSDDLTGETYR